METIIVYGYGLSTDELSNIENAKMAAFIRKHFPDMEFDGINVNDIDDEELIEYAEEIESITTCNCGVYAAIANAMTKETEIQFDYHGFNEDGNGGIVFGQSMPWHFNEKEKNLTKEKLDEIFKIYTDELGLDDSPCEIEIEYYC